MSSRISREELLQLAGGIALLAALLLAPLVLGSPTLGDNHIRWTIRLSLAYYAAAAGLMLSLAPGDWSAGTPSGRWSRVFWTLSFVTYAVHVAVAMHHYHHWSHAHAFEHTRQVAGVGEGIYVSHAFGLLWGLDVAWWWLAPERYARRSAALGVGLHGFMVFIWFNGTVVYEQGIIRWAGLATFLLLAAIWIENVRRRRMGTASSAKA